MNDAVNHPSHYQLFPDLEAIDVIHYCLTDAEYAGYLKGNFLKYKLRAGSKDDALQDIKKAEWYRREYYERFKDHTVTMSEKHPDLSFPTQEEWSKLHSVDVPEPECEHDWINIGPGVEKCAKCGLGSLFGPMEPECEHKFWHRFVLRGVEVCTKCKFERPIDDPAKQVKHTRKSGC